MKCFLKRHSQLSKRNCENLNRSKSLVTRKVVEKFLQNISVEMESLNVKPEFLINYDETNITDDPGHSKVITCRGAKFAHHIMSSTKTSHSIMFCSTASGILLPVYFVFKADHLYDTWTLNSPREARYNRSKSGWFDGALFSEWFRTIFLPYCRKHDQIMKNGKYLLYILHTS